MATTTELPNPAAWAIGPAAQPLLRPDGDSACASERRLSPAEVARWHVLGYLGPYTLMPAAEMSACRARIDADIFVGERARAPRDRNHDRHLDHSTVWRIVSDPALVERVAGLIGPDLILWRTNFQEKNPGDAAVPWHQDGAYFGLQPCVLVSAWIAIDRATIANGCLRVIPGSHRQLLAHNQDASKDAFSKDIAAGQIDESAAVSFELEPGQFVLFNEFTAHGSQANSTQERRLGLTPRMTVPFVRVPPGADGAPRAVSLLRGRDYLGMNRCVPPPG